MHRLVLPIALLVTVQSAESQTLPADDPVLRRMWVEGMERSQTERLAHVLMDSIGPRLSGTPAFQASVDWLQQVYRELGITVRAEQYGTWRGWRHGYVSMTLTAPRIQPLEVNVLAWSPGTSGPIEAEVVALPAFRSARQANEWLATVRGKAVLASPPEPSCREPQAMERLALPETYRRIRDERERLRSAWISGIQGLGGPRQAERRMEEAGAVAILTSNWSEGWGVNKVFGASTERAAALDVSCEDYGMLHRMASSGWKPRVKVNVEAEELGTVPMFNVIAELKGTELPNEYVMLSAHLDSWHSAPGATDNGTGTITMLEAMRILKEAYPNPRRTILAGHWGGEEQGLIGSRSFVEDHPEVVANLQVLFNQDNGTWRVEYIEDQGLAGAGSHIEGWIASLPTEIGRHITLGIPGRQDNTGSDHSAFLCHGAPGLRLQSNYEDYRQYTWHTNRDTYDKIIFDDLRNNATLAAMLAYLASEDPERVPRDRAVLPPDPRTGQPRQWIRCGNARRSW